MFENYSLGALEDGELDEAMEIIHQAKSLYGKEKLSVDKKADKALKKEIKETNLATARETQKSNFSRYSGFNAASSARP